MGSDGRPLGPLPYVRSGLLGFMGPVSFAFRSCISSQANVFLNMSRITIKLLEIVNRNRLGKVVPPYRMVSYSSLVVVRLNFSYRVEHIRPMISLLPYSL